MYTIEKDIMVWYKIVISRCISICKIRKKMKKKKMKHQKTGVASYLAVALGVAVISTVGVVYLRKRNA